jgi:hypothetical protein
MIYEVPITEITLPYTDDGSLCLDRGLLNPRCFHEDFKEYPWYPFEDFSFEEDEAVKLVKHLASHGRFYRQDMPCRGVSAKCYSIEQPDQMDTRKIYSWLCYYEGIFWDQKGNLIINSYADYVILSTSAKISSAVFGNTGDNLYKNSSSVFTKGGQGDSRIADFMAEVRETWGRPGQ